MQRKPLRFSIEDVFNYAIWSAAVCYSLYSFFLECEVFDYLEDTFNDFAPGWSFLERKQDVTDLEWRRNLSLIVSVTPWFIIQLLLCEFASRFLTRSNTSTIIFQYIQLTMSALYLAANYPPAALLPVFLVCLAFCLCYRLRNLIALWLCAGLCALAMHSFTFFGFYAPLNDTNTTAFFHCEVGTFWMILRCSSYFFDKLRSSETTLDNVEFFAYCFYMPVLFSGPFISFQDYRGSLVPARRNDIGLGKRLTRCITNLIRIVLYVFFTEFAMHYIYSSAMMYLPEHVATFNSWSLYGYGYAMGQFFHLKYVVSYGFSLTLCELETVAVPRVPKCIARIHLYSDMWKYFDEGFYNYLLNYVYIPLCGTQRTFITQLSATIVTFFYVFIWHGYSYNIFMWTVINFACILAQKLFQAMVETEGGRQIVANLSVAWRRRLEGVLAAPLLAIAVMSNSYFFAHTEIGDLFFSKFFHSDPSAKFTFFLLLYFLCQVSIHFKQYELTNRPINTKRNCRFTADVFKSKLHTA